jgi:hypothetical protein
MGTFQTLSIAVTDEMRLHMKGDIGATLRVEMKSEVRRETVEDK